MALEITGKIFSLLEPVTGAGTNGPWTKREFVIETQEQYPKKVCLEAWNDKATALDSIGTGADVKVSFDVSSREYNQKWYTSLRIWKLEVVSGVNAGAPQQNGGASMGGAPVTMPSNQEINQSFAANSTDDLPF